MPQRLRINEIFHSVQGEGTRAGVRCVFVRLTGCHLRCSWCDTEYAFYEGGWMTLDEIMAQVATYNCDTVEVTGGEPLLQPAVFELMARLADRYSTVMVETSGAVSIADVDPRVIRIVDLKCPDSGEADKNCWDNIALLKATDEVKFVIASRRDYDWAVDVVTKHGLAARCPVLFSPVHGSLHPRELTEWLLADGLDVRLSLQVHKYVWDPETRGV
jgi:7-carboxy-7-deazaguanine synthase